MPFRSVFISGLGRKGKPSLTLRISSYGLPGWICLRVLGIVQTGRYGGVESCQKSYLVPVFFNKIKGLPRIAAMLAILLHQE